MYYIKEKITVLFCLLAVYTYCYSCVSCHHKVGFTIWCWCHKHHERCRKNLYFPNQNVFLASKNLTTWLVKCWKLYTCDAGIEIGSILASHWCSQRTTGTNVILYKCAPTVLLSYSLRRRKHSMCMRHSQKHQKLQLSQTRYGCVSTLSLLFIQHHCCYAGNLSVIWRQFCGLWTGIIWHCAYGCWHRSSSQTQYYAWICGAKSCKKK